MPKVRLLELYAHGLGVIDDARLDFGPGFNVITGETGAGKTLLVDALGLCLGADATTTRHAITTETRAVALFESDGHELVFAREATATGRLRSSLNGAPSSVDALAERARDLIVIHGQHDSLALRGRGEIVRLIDAYGTVNTDELTRVREASREIRRLRDEAGGDSSSRQSELELEMFQLRELQDAAVISIDELTLTLEQLTLLTSLRDSQVALQEVLRSFDDDEESILAHFARALSRLPEDAAYDEARMGLTGALLQAREALSDVAALANPEAYDEATIANLDQRAATLQTIGRKYGGSLDAALTMKATLEASVARRRSEAERFEVLDQELHELTERKRVLARRARLDREFAATALTNAVRAQLPRVALSNASLRFVVDGDDGSDAQLYFTPNPGLPEGPLATLASGGELSRVLLAISLETASEDVVAVFDEIDAGLGGQVAQQIGECLYEVGRRQQVLAITHLASVAVRADHHFVIEKTFDHGVTRTHLRQVRGEERVHEVARMLAGDESTDESSALARQLIENARQDASGVDISR